MLVVFENLGKKLDFSAQSGGVTQYLLPAIGAFIVLASALLLVAYLGKRPVADEAKPESINGEP